MFAGAGHAGAVIKKKRSGLSLQMQLFHYQ
jgi:hypothetical protein